MKSNRFSYCPVLYRVRYAVNVDARWVWVSTMGAAAGAAEAVGCAGRSRQLSGGVEERFLPMLRNLRRSCGRIKVIQFASGILG